MKKNYNTPHRTRVVKTRMTEDEYAEFSEQLSLYGISQAEFIRRAIRGLPIHPIIKVSPVNDELLSAIGKLTAEYGKIGSNLNQMPDMYFEFEDYVIVVEVTMSTNSRQEAMEGEPVRRHVADYVEKYNKPVYGIFVANKISIFNKNCSLHQKPLF